MWVLAEILVFDVYFCQDPDAYTLNGSSNYTDVILLITLKHFGLSFSNLRYLKIHCFLII